MTFFGTGAFVLIGLFIPILIVAAIARDNKIKNIIAIISLCSMILGVMFAFFDTIRTGGTVIYPYLIMLATEIAFLIAIPFKCKTRATKIGFSCLTTSLCSLLILIINCIINSDMSVIDKWIAWSWFTVNICAAAVLAWISFLIHTNNQKASIKEDVSDKSTDSLSSNQTLECAQTGSSTSTADEILKYKNLLDMGAITQEEYEAKKKLLLNI